MPVLDSCHFQIAQALRKDGWTVVDKPTYIDAATPIYIDLAASKTMNGAGTVQHIFVEVKCFPGKNPTQELYIAVGQYMIYRALLAEANLRVPLYLAVPSTIENKILNVAVRQAIRENHMKMIIVDVDLETIVQWME